MSGKIIFLDFDGVLNSEQYIRKCGGYGVVIDPAKMVLLKQIVEATAAEVVLSTSWREHWSQDTAQCDGTGTQINHIFRKYGLRIFDKTPQLHTRREEEIRNWLDEHPEVENFVVLDDMLLSGEFLTGHFVKISAYFGGMDETDVQNAIEILNG